MPSAVYFLPVVIILVSLVVATASLILFRRIAREFQLMPNAFIKSLIGSLACEMGFIAGILFIIISGIATIPGDPPVRHTALLFAIMAGVIYLELGAPLGALVRGHPFSRIEKGEGGGWANVTYLLRKTSRHGYRMGLFFASFLPVLAGLRLQIAWLPGWAGSIAAFVWVATVLWVLRGRSLFPVQQPLVAFVAAAVSLISANLSGDAFVQVFSLLVLSVCCVALALNLPRLLPTITWASGGYFLALLTIMNGHRSAGFILLVLILAAAAMANLSRKKNCDRRQESKGVAV